MQLEKKEDIKERLGRSPDLADSLALTLAAPVARAIDVTLAERRQEAHPYDPLAW
jgi:ribosomal protein L13E